MRRLGLGLLLWCAASAAQAAVTCVVTTLPVVFGGYDPTSLADNTAGQGTVTVTCTLLLGLSDTASYEIQLGPGTGTVAQRQMALLASRLNYNLYTNAGRTQVWGDGGGTAGLSDSYTIGAVPVVRSYPAYGKITARQAVTAGAYADAIVVTVIY